MKKQQFKNDILKHLKERNEYFSKENYERLFIRAFGDEDYRKKTDPAFAEYFAGLDIKVVQGSKSSKNRVLMMQKDGMTVYVKFTGVHTVSPFACETCEDFFFVEPQKKEITTYVKV